MIKDFQGFNLQNIDFLPILKMIFLVPVNQKSKID